MGMFPGKTCMSSPYAVPNSAPNPEHYTLLRERNVGNILIIEVQYPDAQNFEGRKIMVYRGFTSFRKLVLHNRGRLDPHFEEDGAGSPVARFRPTAQGWSMAYVFACAMTQEQ